MNDCAIIRVLVLNKGPIGPAGPSTDLEIGTVTTGAPGSPADAQITGTPPNLTLDLTLPQGDEGPIGPIGPDGPTGPPGAAATLAVGATTVVTPDQDPDVSNSGTSAAAVFDFDLPRAPTFTVGTVASVPFGDPTTVTDVGTDGDVVLDFDLQRGEDGADGDDGWSPILAIVVDLDRRVLQVTDWAGGTGTKPATGDYIGPTGLVSDIAQAVDIRGPQGPLSGGLEDLNDVTITDPQQGETIAYDAVSGFWFNSAPVGAVGGGTDQLFYLNDTNATANYTLPAGRNAMSAGPIEIDPSVTITVPSGSTLTVV